MTPNSETQMKDRSSRRDFLRAAGTLLGGAMGGSLLGACTGGASGGGSDTAAAAARDTVMRATEQPIGLQLYTVRDLMERDVEQTLASVAEIGYEEVEFAGYFGREPRALRDTLDRLRLSAPATHVPVEMMRDKLDEVLATSQVLGHRWIVVPWLAEQDRTLASYRRLAGEFNQWGQACSERGMRFAYHNHEFEFEPTDGVVPYDVLLTETDPSLVEMELDLYWATVGGQDPVAMFERHRGRFPLWHVKDGTFGAGGRTMTAVGEGEIDFRRILDHASASGMQHMFVEHDEPADPLAVLRTSHDNLRRLLG